MTRAQEAACGCDWRDGLREVILVRWRVRSGAPRHKETKRGGGSTAAPSQ
ncbi:hypothetical protein IMCC12053_2215 [Celeribacter marinus]|uniref:Uncharacterized protein n=1 Tax=Celeribacter marinus TaxID=1397108 RepID=A0A0P0AD89_9RHOB|nr:hypothetical protein IMCC12053_2215 [Celeribacter marinus]